MKRSLRKRRQAANDNVSINYIEKENDKKKGK